MFDVADAPIAVMVVVLAIGVVATGFLLTKLSAAYAPFTLGRRAEAGSAGRRGVIKASPAAM